jgi:cytochrome P450
MGWPGSCVGSLYPVVVSDLTYPPGPSSPPTWQLGRFAFDFVRYLERCAARYGDVFTLRASALGPLVVATGPAEVQAILTDRERFVGGEAAELLEPVIGRRSVIIAGGAEHMRQRKRLLAPFHGAHVARWTGRIAALAERELSGLPLDRPIAIRPAMQRITLAVICEVVFGLPDPAPFRDAVVRFLAPRLSFVMFLPTLTRRRGALNPVRTFLARRAAAQRLLDEEIARRAAGPPRDDVLSLLLEARDEDGAPLEHGAVRDELMGLLVAGHETTATGLAWAFERLSRTPAVDQRRAAEDRAYLDAVVNETLRTRPPVIDAVRAAVADTELGGRPVPAGTLVSAMFSLTHRRADLWPDPLAFRPERFLDGKPLPYAYTPFGGASVAASAPRSPCSSCAPCSRLRCTGSRSLQRRDGRSTCASPASR